MYFPQNTLVYLNVVLFTSMIRYEVPNVLHWVSTVPFLIFKLVEYFVDVMLYALRDILLWETCILVFTQKYETVFNQKLGGSRYDLYYSNFSSVVKCSMRANFT